MQEVVAFLYFGSEFLKGVDGRVHTSPELRSNVSERQSYIGKSYGTNDHKVHVAARALLGSGNGTIDKRDLYAIGKRRESLPENVNEAYGLKQHPFKLRKNRTVPVSLEIDPVAVFAARKNAGIGQKPELALNAGRLQFQVSG